MKKIFFGMALMLFSIFLCVLDRGYDLPAVVEFVYIFVPIIALAFCFIGLFEKEK